MPSYLIRKLERFAPLSDVDKDVLMSLARRPLKNLLRGDDVIHEGEAVTGARIFLSGWAYRYKYLEDGRRQIMSFLLPGDFCDLNGFALRTMDHSIAAATSLTVAEIPHEIIASVISDHPMIHQALCWDQQVAMALLRELIVSMGQRNALERMAHLLCELCTRLNIVGLADNWTFDFPLTQTELAAATGLSTVHVNRTLQELRRIGLVSSSARRLQIHDLERLRTIAGFNLNYLHLDEPPVSIALADVEPHRFRAAFRPHRQYSGRII